MTHKMKNLLYILFLFPSLVFAQSNLPLNREFTFFYEKEGKTFEYLRDTTYGLHLEKEGVESLNDDTPNDDPRKRTIYCTACDKITKAVYNEHLILSCFKPHIVVNPVEHTRSDYGSLFYKKLTYENLLIVNDTVDKFYLTIDPLFNFEYGKDFADKTGEKLYKNTRGFLVRGDIGKKISFESSFYENQATYVQYIDDYIRSTNDLFPQTANYSYDVIPGQGRAKKFKANGYDFAMTSGYVSYSPVKMLNI